MFAIPFNFPFRKSNGDMSTIGAEISAGGGGGGESYILPTASSTTKGGIKIGAGLSMDGETLNNDNPTPATPYSLPTASAETLGGVKVGDGLSINESGVLSATGGGGGSSLSSSVRTLSSSDFTSNKFTATKKCYLIYNITDSQTSTRVYVKIQLNNVTIYKTASGDGGSTEFTDSRLHIIIPMEIGDEVYISVITGSTLYMELIELS